MDGAGQDARGGGSAAVAVLVYVLCSSTMLVINKAAMNALPFSNTVSALQTGVGAVMLYICRSAGAIEQFPAPTASKVAGWSPVVMVWIVPIALNMAAMRYLTVETLMMFRSVTIVLVAVGDYLVLGNALQPRQQVACAIISVGGIIYASHDISFHLVGYLLGAAYSVAMLVNSIYTKFAFNQNKSMTTWEKSFLNNLVATPVMLVCVAAMEDVGKMQHTFVNMAPLQATCVALSCVMGLGISMSGIKCRDILSATSFDVLGNCTKYLTLAVNALVLGSSTNSLSLLGILLALTGSALYSPAGAFIASKFSSTTGQAKPADSSAPKKAM